MSITTSHRDLGAMIADLWSRASKGRLDPAALLHPAEVAMLHDAYEDLSADKSDDAAVIARHVARRMLTGRTWVSSGFIWKRITDGEGDSYDPIPPRSAHLCWLQFPRQLDRHVALLITDATAREMFRFGGNAVLFRDAMKPGYYEDDDDSCFVVLAASEGDAENVLVLRNRRDVEV